MLGTLSNERDSTPMAKPLRMGLVGTGGISRRHLPAYQQFPDQVQLTAACDIVEDAVAEFGKRNGIDAVYTDFDKMLREADIDAVDICTAHNAHAPLAVAAAEAGKHAITEKPMAISLDECRQMIEAADKAGVTLMVAQHLRSYAGGPGREAHARRRHARDHPGRQDPCDPGRRPSQAPQSRHKPIGDATKQSPAAAFS